MGNTTSLTIVLRRFYRNILVTVRDEGLKSNKLNHHIVQISLQVTNKTSADTYSYDYSTCQVQAILTADLDMFPSRVLWLLQFKFDICPMRYRLKNAIFRN